MPRYKLIVILIVIFLLIFFLIRSDSVTSFIKASVNNQRQPAPLPAWLTRTHRFSGPYAFDYIPLDPDDLTKPNEENGPENSAPPAGRTYFTPSVSPYPPGTLADMIWQQKQQDQRYGN